MGEQSVKYLERNGKGMLKALYTIILTNAFRACGGLPLFFQFSYLMTIIFGFGGTIAYPKRTAIPIVCLQQ